jgi:hypothetical protein
MSRRNFIKWLQDHSYRNKNTIKAYAVRFCGCTVRQYMFNFIDNIVLRISEIVDDIEEDEQNRDLLNPSQVAEILLSFGFNPQGSVGDSLLAILLDNFFSGRERVPCNTNRKFSIQTNIVECSETDQCDCSICYDAKEKDKFVKLNCGHEFCKDCIKESLKNVRTEKPQCAFCRAEIQNIELSSETIRDEFNDLLTISM